MSTQFMLLNRFRVLYYLPVGVLGRYQTIFPAPQTNSPDPVKQFEIIPS